MRTMRDKAVFHPADAARLARPGGMFGTKRWFKDGEGGDGGGGAGGGGGGGAQDWRAALPDDLRGEAMFRDIPDVPTLAKVARDAKSALGSSLRAPGPDAGPEAHKEFAEKLGKTVKGKILYVPEDAQARAAVEASVWETLGRPKDATGYSLEGLQLDAAFGDDDLRQLRDVATRRGYTKAQFAELAKDVARERAAAVRGQRENETALRAEFGAAYDDRMREIAAVAEATGAPQHLREAIARRQLDKPTALYLHALGKRLGVEAREIANQRGGAAGALAPAEAETRILEIMRRPEYLDASRDPALHKQLVQEVARLEAFASPDLARASE